MKLAEIKSISDEPESILTPDEFKIGVNQLELIRDIINSKYEGKYYQVRTFKDKRNKQISQLFWPNRPSTDPWPGVTVYMKVHGAEAHGKRHYQLWGGSQLNRYYDNIEDAIHALMKLLKAKNEAK